MTIKVFGVVISTNSLVKAVADGSITITEAAVAALMASDDPNAKAVATEVEAEIVALKADTTSTGLQKLELAAAAALRILSTYGFPAVKDFAIQLVQTIYNKAVAGIEHVGHQILEMLGLEKDKATA